VADCVQPEFRRISVSFDNVSRMETLTFERRIVQAYEQVFAQLDESAAHAVRFWAFVPGIHDDLGDGLTRYMAFNAGRYGAFATRFGSQTTFGRSVPAASAVGVAGDRFTLHCLGASEPGLPVENPRQVSAYHYSRRFGPLPPCFARATLLRRETDVPMLLVAGTASITGEESRHLDAPCEQAGETFVNLANVVASAVGRTLPHDTPETEIRLLLASFRDVRVYYRNSTDRETLTRLVSEAFSPRCRVEWFQASLCRPELLVEIEGVAFPRTAGAIHRSDPDVTASAP